VAAAILVTDWDAAWEDYRLSGADIWRDSDAPDLPMAAELLDSIRFEGAIIEANGEIQNLEAMVARDPSFRALLSDWEPFWPHIRELLAFERAAWEDLRHAGFPAP